MYGSIWLFGHIGFGHLAMASPGAINAVHKPQNS